MKKYELNGLGEQWTWEASSEEEATKMLICAVMGRHHSIEEYERYCNDVGYDSDIEWREVEEEDDECCACHSGCNSCLGFTERDFFYA